MYGKIFSSMFEGSLYGNPDAIVTMMVMIVLSDRDGNVDMTPQAIAARTSLPLDMIRCGIAFLEAPDPHSRTMSEDGRRLIRLDDHRDWGWNIVNYVKYREIRSAEERRNYWREWKKNKRATSTDSTDVHQMSTDSTNSRSRGRSISKGINNISVDSTAVEANTLVKGLSQETWNEFRENRVKIKSPMTASGENRLLRRLAKIAEAGDDPEEVVSRSIEGNWKGLFPLSKPGIKNDSHQRIDNSAPGRVRAANGIRR
jgi:hypothetical protein